jgi:hypothetical protein
MNLVGLCRSMISIPFREIKFFTTNMSLEEIVR